MVLSKHQDIRGHFLIFFGVSCKSYKGPCLLLLGGVSIFVQGRGGAFWASANPHESLRDVCNEKSVGIERDSSN